MFSLLQPLQQLQTKESASSQWNSLPAQHGKNNGRDDKSTREQGKKRVWKEERQKMLWTTTKKKLCIFMLVITFQLADPCNMRMEDWGTATTEGAGCHHNSKSQRPAWCRIIRHEFEKYCNCFLYSRVLEMCCCCCCLHNCILEQLTLGKLYYSI